MPERITLLVLAQTEPTISRKYVETVCTAGITEEQSWLRLYPIQKRVAGQIAAYGKYDWIECEVYHSKNNKDVRRESRHVYADTIQKVGSMTKGGKPLWDERRRFLLRNGITVYTKLLDIVEGARRNEFSLCLFKPTEVETFYAKEESPSYTREQEEIIKNYLQQGVLFSAGDNAPGKPNFIKVPYSFHCSFRDATGRSSDLSVLDWEITSRYRHGVKKHGKEQARDETLEYYKGLIQKRDIYFILGTRNEAHNIKMNSKRENNINPWSIISVIPFPFTPDSEQLTLPLNHSPSAMPVSPPF